MDLIGTAANTVELPYEKQGKSTPVIPRLSTGGAGHLLYIFMMPSTH